MNTKRRPVRRGATTVEGVVVLSVLLVFIIAMLDLGIAVFRKQVLSYGARHGARVAAVHGSEAATLGSWGPGTYGPIAVSDTAAIPSEIRAQLSGINASQVTVTIDWLDGDNEPGSRVRVTLQSSYQAAMPRLWGSGPVVLTATSTAIIAH